MIKSGIQQMKTRGVKLPVNGNETTISNPEIKLSKYLFFLFKGMVKNKK